MQLVLFVSMHDSSRGPLAAAVFNHLADPALARAASAGLLPGRALSRLISQLVEQTALILPPDSPRRVISDDLQRASLVIHIGNADTRRLPGNEIAWHVPSIRPGTLERARLVLQNLEVRIACLLAERGW
jgi:protein-tyrosine-phosphatase